MALRQEQTWQDQKMAGFPGGLRRPRAGGEGRGGTYGWCSGGGVPLQSPTGKCHDPMLVSKQ